MRSVRPTYDAGGRSCGARARSARPRHLHAPVRQANTPSRAGGPRTTRRLPSPRANPRLTPGRRCSGQLHGMQLAGANLPSSRFTFVVCRASAATCRETIDLQKTGERYRRAYHTPGGSPTGIPIMEDRNQTVNDSHTIRPISCAGGACVNRPSNLRPATPWS